MPFSELTPGERSTLPEARCDDPRHLPSYDDLLSLTGPVVPLAWECPVCGGRTVFSARTLVLWARLGDR